MAVMYPDTPHECTPESREIQMFKCLEERLPGDYYVFHSFKIVDVKENIINDLYK